MRRVLAITRDDPTAKVCVMCESRPVQLMRSIALCPPPWELPVRPFLLLESSALLLRPLFPLQVLVFSFWVDVLLILGHALEANQVPYAFGKVGACVEV